MADTDTQLAILADALIEILDLATNGHSALASPADLLERAGDIAAKALTAAATYGKLPPIEGLGNQV
ncbi:hypothetical protein SAMN05519103_08571 [Rhizobiales bacterium GAS113]|nr:hypothetical protein SAMN05519103_08571 [Rhizobiales bacterium GAS113]